VRRKVDGSTKWGACASPKTHQTRDGKGRGAIHALTRRNRSESGDSVAGMGTRCRSGRRPGGSVLAIIEQGLQANLSLPPSCNGVSYSRQCSKAHIIAWDSVRMKAMGRESTRVEETPTTPELAKDLPVTGQTDGCGSLGQADGAQGALSQPEWHRGCDHTLESLPRDVDKDRKTSRGSYVRPGCREAETDPS